MGWEGILAIVLAAPVLALPVAFTWYLTIGGMRGWAREKGKTTEKAEGKATAG